MGRRDAQIQRDMYQESKGFTSIRAQQGPGQIPIIADDVNDGQDIFFHQMRRLAQISLGDGFTGTAFKITENTANSNDFNITGGDGTDDAAARGYISGLPLRRYNTLNFLSTGDEEIHAKSTAITATVLIDTAANYTGNELVGRTLYPNALNNTGFSIAANTKTTITVIGNLLAIAQAGDRYKIGMTTPSSSRTDTVILDAYVDEIDTDEDSSLYHNLARASGSVSIESAIRKKVEQKVWIKQNYSDTPDSSFIDNDGNKHYVARIATISRTSGVSTISSSAINDTRLQDYPEGDRVFQNLRVEQSTQLSGTIVVSGTTNFYGSGTKPKFNNGIDITGDNFNYNDINKDFLSSSRNTVFSGTNLSLDFTAIINYGATTFKGESSGNRPLLVHSHISGAAKAWFDGDARLHLDSLLSSRQVLIKPSGSSNKGLILYDYPSGTLERYSIREDGAIVHTPELNTGLPFHDVVMVDNTVAGVRLKGTVTTATELMLIQNDSVAGTAPLLKLKSSTPIGTLNPVLGVYDHPLFETWRPGETDPAVRIWNLAGIHLREEDGGNRCSYSIYNNDDALTFKASSYGTVQINTEVGVNESLQIGRSAGTYSLQISPSGVITCVDNASNTPGLLVTTQGGTNRVRVNVKGLILSSAEVTQDATTPGTLNVLANDGILLNYDYNDDGSGAYVFNAGSVAAAKLGTKTDPSMNVYRNLTVGSSGTTSTKVRLETGAGASGYPTFELYSSNAGEEAAFGIDASDIYLKDVIRGLKFLSYGHDSSPNVTIGAGESTSNSSVEIDAERLYAAENKIVGLGVWGSGVTSIFVDNTYILPTATSEVFVMPKNNGGGEYPRGIWWVSNIITASGFQVNSSAVESGCLFSYLIVNGS